MELLRKSKKIIIRVTNDENEHQKRSTGGLFIFIFLIEHFFIMPCVHTKYSKLNKANK